MKLTEEDVRHVAELANLELRDDEIVKMTHDLRGILTHIDKLNEVDTSNVQPMTQVIPFAAVPDDDPSPTLRDDVERPTLGTAAAIANAPLASKQGPGSGYFKVPKVIER